MISYYDIILLHTRTSFIESNQLRQAICIVGNGAPHSGFGALHACTHKYSSFSLSFFLPMFSYIMTTLCAVFCLPAGLSLSNTIRAISAGPLPSSPWSTEASYQGAGLHAIRVFCDSDLLRGGLAEKKYINGVRMHGRAQRSRVAFGLGRSRAAGPGERMEDPRLLLAG